MQGRKSPNGCPGLALGRSCYSFGSGRLTWRERFPGDRGLWLAEMPVFSSCSASCASCPRIRARLKLFALFQCEIRFRPEPGNNSLYMRVASAPRDRAFGPIGAISDINQRSFLPGLHSACWGRNLDETARIFEARTSNTRQIGYIGHFNRSSIRMRAFCTSGDRDCPIWHRKDWTE
jgi:hypothetical protein